MSVKKFIPLAATAVLVSLTACGGGTQSSTPSTSVSPAASTSASTSASPAGSPMAQTMPNSASAHEVNVTETEMKVMLSSTTIPAGSTKFVVQNAGKVPHELVIFQTDLPIAQLPMKGKKLDEDNSKLKNVADTGEEYLKGGETRTLEANLTPGHYVAICNVGRHFMRGMKAEFTVQ